MNINGHKVEWTQQFKDSTPVLLLDGFPLKDDIKKVLQLNVFEYQEIMNAKPSRHMLSTYPTKDLLGKRVVYDHHLFLDYESHLDLIKKTVQSSSGYMTLNEDHSINKLYYEKNPRKDLIACIGEQDFKKNRDNLIKDMLNGKVLYCTITHVADVYYRIYDMNGIKTLSESIIYYI